MLLSLACGLMSGDRDYRLVVSLMAVWLLCCRACREDRWRRSLSVCSRLRSMGVRFGRQSALLGERGGLLGWSGWSRVEGHGCCG